MADAEVTRIISRRLSSATMCAWVSTSNLFCCTQNLVNFINIFPKFQLGIRHCDNKSWHIETRTVFPIIFEVFSGPPLCHEDHISNP